MRDKTTATRNIIRRKTFQEATKGNARTIYDIEEELQDVLPVSDAVRDHAIGRMNFIMDEARTKVTDTAVKYWVQAGQSSRSIPEAAEDEISVDESDTPVDTGVDGTMAEDGSEHSRTSIACMWLDIITDERKLELAKVKAPKAGMGLEFASARSMSLAKATGEGKYSALGGAYIRFLPPALTPDQRKELDILTDSWDAFLAVYNSLTLKYKGQLQESGAVKIPGGPTLTGRTQTDDVVWNDFMDSKKVRNPTLDYVMRNVKMFGKYYEKIAKKTVGFSSSSVNTELATTLINAALKGAVSGSYIGIVASVVSSVPKRINWKQSREVSEDVEFQCMVPTFYVDPDTGTFRIRMNVLDARFSMEAARKSGLCWSQLRGSFEYTVRLRKYTVNRGVLKGVFGDNTKWIEEGKNFLGETTNDGTSVEVETSDEPW